MWLWLVLLALIIFFMYVWMTPVKKQGCSTCPNRKNADSY